MSTTTHMHNFIQPSAWAAGGKNKCAICHVEKAEHGQQPPTEPQAAESLTCIFCGNTLDENQYCSNHGDDELAPTSPRVHTATPSECLFYCKACGNTQTATDCDDLGCDQCGNSDWSPRITTPTETIMATFNLSDEQYDAIQAIAPDNTAVLAAMVNAYAKLKNQHDQLVATLRLVVESYVTSDDNGIAAQKAREALAAEQEGGD